MSFDFYVPCNCRKKGQVNWPPFRDKLEIRNGIIDIKEAHIDDIELENKYDSWTFCEHNQVAMEKSMVQAITGLKKYIEEQYPNKFTNFKDFIPVYNDRVSHNYNKKNTIMEIEALKKLDNGKFDYYLNQFIDLLQKAIELEQNIYW